MATINKACEKCELTGLVDEFSVCPKCGGEIKEYLEHRGRATWITTTE